MVTGFWLRLRKEIYSCWNIQNLKTFDLESPFDTIYHWRNFS